MAWEKVNEMFPNGFAVTNEGIITNDNIVRENPPFIHTTFRRSIRGDMTEWEEEIYWFRNGDMKRFYSYHLLPFGGIDNTPLLNAYAQHIYNGICEKSRKEGEKHD